MIKRKKTPIADIQKKRLLKRDSNADNEDDTSVIRDAIKMLETLISAIRRSIRRSVTLALKN